jgi:hypothetical protein
MRMRGERIVFGQFDGDLVRGFGSQAAGFVQRGEFGEFCLGRRAQLDPLRSLANWAFSLSRWLLTDTYSPSAIDTAPATRPASPAVKIGPRWLVAPATPRTMPATDTIPSLAPSTPARSQFSRPARPAPCDSNG